ncbi:hypothetical protein [Facklamia sp. 7083-14-GEN3]|uniref:hypothetical protein n=1 Tax=Facklamia sp. 7083-14-GEN3 TaxID=2973478 RepID=UPI00215C85E0|nr:hypothetical protein [Facklamia sp. 7083-14-GEN3]MCR8968567.1 hypothetical protein [Facklamia sp. 7083-14-GEN3]
MLSKIYWVIEILILISGFFVNNYASKRSGLYRHVYYREFQFNQFWFAENYRWIWFVVAISILLIAIIAILKTKKWIQSCYQFSWKIHWIILVIISLFELVIMSFFADKSVFIMYPYFLLGLPLLGVGNLIACLLIFFFHRQTKECESKTGDL